MRELKQNGMTLIFFLESERLEQLVSLMTNEDYQEIAKRLCIRFSKIFNKTEEEVI